MGETKQARLVERGRNFFHGGTYEIWDVGGGAGVYVDFYATGGKAIRDLGYEIAEGDGRGTYCRESRCCCGSRRWRWRFYRR